jgi:uncharacterized protein (TIGR00266 family)
MQTTIHGSPSFAYIDTTLDPGETIVSEADAMSTMAAELDLKAKLNGGLLSAICKRFLGGESLFVSHYTNNTDTPLHLTLTQSTPGDITALDLAAGQSICLQPGAYICSTPDVSLKVRWAGIVSGIAREGFSKLQAQGPGQLWFGAYGGLVEKEIDGEYIVDTSHLVAYEPQMKLKLQMAGGIFSSFFGGEGLVTRVEGRGKIWIQTRSLSGLAGWINPRLY